MSKSVISFEELAKHKSRSDCWIAINGKVYNVTEFLSQHPGGSEEIIANAGVDATQAFNSKGGEGHSKAAARMLDKYFVGDLDLNSKKGEAKEQPKEILRKYTWEEVAKHTTEDDCWVVLYNKVYDVTNFLLEHPGGPGSILEQTGGLDATGPFEEHNHSQNAKEILKKYQIGLIDLDSPKPQIKKASANLLPIILTIFVLSLFGWAYLNYN